MEKRKKHGKKLWKAKKKQTFIPLWQKPVVYNFEEISGKNERATHSGGAEKHRAISDVWRHPRIDFQTR